MRTTCSGDQVIFNKTAALLFMIGLVFLFIVPVQACRYTVRELGFCDLAAPPYRLYICHRLELSPAQIEKLSRLVDSACSGSNLEVQWVGPDAEPPSLLHYRPAGHAGLPWAALTSPESARPALVFASRDDDLHSFASRTIQTVLRSPVRETLLRHTPATHAAVLFFSGHNGQQNENALARIQAALQQVEPVLPLMPKPASRPPFIITIPIAEQNQEAVLKWSLGLDADENPQAVILYGRGRRMGPILRGNSLTTEALYNLLLYVGADCECEMDRSYLHGYLIPLPWPQAVRDRISKTLGFDPDNPIVKMDMLHIARIYSNRQDLNPAPAPPKPAAATIGNSTKAKTFGRTIVYAMILFGLLVLLGAGVILFFLKRRSSS